MYKNLNQLSSTNLNIEYNNTKDISIVQRQLNTAVAFKKSDLVTDALTNQVKLYVYDRIIKNCIIVCPDGQTWTGLDYQIHQSQGQFDRTYTVFNFSYIPSTEWDQNAYYYIYAGSMDNGVTLSNANFDQGINILHNVGTHYFLKKLIAGNDIQIKDNNDSIIISKSDSNYVGSVYNIADNHGIIDILNGNMQIVYTYQDDQIVDVIDSYMSNSESSDISDSSWNYGINMNSILTVSLLIYKPNQTTLKYNTLTVLQRYDIGWFSCVIKKIFGKLFISQPTRIITDFEI